VTTNTRTALPLALTVLLASGAASPAFGLVEIARGLVLLQTTGSVTYDSYFLGTVDNKPDYIYTVAPNLQYSRRAGRAQIGLSAGMAFNRYDRNKEYDSDDLRASASFELPTVEGARFTGQASASYSEETVVDYFLNDRVPTETTSAGFTLAYRPGLKVGLSETFRYNTTTRDIYSNQDFLTNNFAVTYYDFLRKTNLSFEHGFSMTSSSGDNIRGAALDLTSNSFSVSLSRPLYGEVIGGITYGHNIISRSGDETSVGQTRSSSNFFSLTVDGPFLPPQRFPKLKSAASLSYQQSNTLGINDVGGKFLAGSVSLAWNARERTSFNVGATRSIDLSANDFSVENTRVSAGFAQQIGYSTSLSGSVGYSWATFRGVSRSDNALSANLGLSRSFNKYLSAGVNYTYTLNENDSAGIQTTRFAPRDYERHTVSAYISTTF